MFVQSFELVLADLYSRSVSNGYLTVDLSRAPQSRFFHVQISLTDQRLHWEEHWRLQPRACRGRYQNFVSIPNRQRHGRCSEGNDERTIRQSTSHRRGGIGFNSSVGDPDARCCASGSGATAGYDSRQVSFIEADPQITLHRLANLGRPSHRPARIRSVTRSAALTKVTYRLTQDLGVRATKVLATLFRALLGSMTS